MLNQKGNHNRVGNLAGTRYVNGGLFSTSSGIMLDRGELTLLRKAAEFDWRQVDPTIFGSLLEGILGEERRAELGAHYTHEADIMKVVPPRHPAVARAHPGGGRCGLYGWPKSAAQDSADIVARLTQLNREITEGTRRYSPFEPPKDITH